MVLGCHVRVVTMGRVLVRPTRMSDVLQSIGLKESVTWVSVTYEPLCTSHGESKERSHGESAGVSTTFFGFYIYYIRGKTRDKNYWYSPDVNQEDMLFIIKR